MKNNCLRSASRSEQTESRIVRGKGICERLELLAERCEVRSERLGSRMVLASAFHETGVFAGDCMLRGSDSLFREFPAHLKSFHAAKCV